MRERETKLLIDPDVPFPPIEELLAEFGEQATETVAQTATYFDTADLRLTREGVSLRFRSDDGWTIKIPKADAGDGLSRDEQAFGAEVGDPPAAALEAVLPWARSEPLSDVARIETRRERTRIFAEDGSIACEVDDDDVHGFVNGELTIHFREVEVETPDDGDRAVGKRVVKALRAAGAGASPSVPKIARVLGDAAATPPDLPTPPELDKHSTVTDLVRASISTAAESLIDHDALARAGEDPEGVHRARVATRRLRSHLRTFGPLVDEEWSDRLRAELQWLGAELGHVRDADVLLGKIEIHADALPTDLHAASLAITDSLRTQRDRDRATLLAAMRSPRYVSLLDDLIDGALAPQMRADRRDDLVVDSVRRMTRHPRKRLRTTVKALPDAPSADDLHEVRKRAKQTRYAYEAIALVVGTSARRTAARLTELQDLLGDHHDATVAFDWLRAAASDQSDPEVAFVAGVIADRFVAEERRIGNRWRSAWHRVRREM